MTTLNITRFDKYLIKDNRCVVTKEYALKKAKTVQQKSYINDLIGDVETWSDSDVVSRTNSRHFETDCKALFDNVEVKDYEFYLNRDKEWQILYESRRGKIGDAPTRVYPCVSCMGSKGKMSYLYYKPPFTLSQPTVSCNIRRNIIFNSQPIINTPSEVNSSPEPASPVPSVTVEYGSSQACPISFDDPVEELPSNTNTQRTCDTEVSSLDDTISEYSTNESDSDLDISEDATVSCESSPVRPNKAVAVTNDSSFHGFDLSSEATLIANRALPFLPLRVTKKKSDYSYVASLVDKHRNFITYGFFQHGL
ncbi:hypothetical protein MOUN0_F00144 [Monosporozyma unispora]